MENYCRVDVWPMSLSRRVDQKYFLFLKLIDRFITKISHSQFYYDLITKVLRTQQILFLLPSSYIFGANLHCFTCSLLLCLHGNREQMPFGSTTVIWTGWTSRKWIIFYHFCCCIGCNVFMLMSAFVWTNESQYSI